MTYFVNNLSRLSTCILATRKFHVVYMVRRFVAKGTVLGYHTVFSFSLQTLPRVFCRLSD
jgi:hypothetical protein